MRISVSRLLLVCLGLLLASCRSEQEEQLLVGAILAETGPASFIGTPERLVLDSLWAETQREAPDPPNIALRIEDSEGDPNDALAIFRRFVAQENLIAIIGPSTSGESTPLARRAKDAQVPLLSLAASNEIVTDSLGNTRQWVFKFAQNDILAARRLAQVMQREGDSNIALLYVNDGFGRSGAAVFRDQAGSANIDLVIDRSYPPNLSTPETYLRTIDESVDAVLLWGTSRPPMIVRALRSQGYEGQIYLSHGNASESFISTAGPASEGIILVGSKVLLMPRFLDSGDPADRVVQRYRSFWQSNFSGEPSHFGGHARDALQALLTVIPSQSENLSVADLRGEIRARLEGLEHFYGVTGTFDFAPDDHAGLTAEAFETYRILNGSFIPYQSSDG